VDGILPFVCGWNVVDLFNFKSIFSQRVVQKALRNLVSLSKMMLLGIPKCTKTYSKNMFVASCPLMVLQGIRMHILMNLSTTSVDFSSQITTSRGSLVPKTRGSRGSHTPIGVSLGRDLKNRLLLFLSWVKGSMCIRVPKVVILDVGGLESMSANL
jgi:hypothetical protein